MTSLSETLEQNSQQITQIVSETLEQNSQQITQIVSETLEQNSQQITQIVSEITLLFIFSIIGKYLAIFLPGYAL